MKKCACGCKEVIISSIHWYKPYHASGSKRPIANKKSRTRCLCGCRKLCSFNCKWIYGHFSSYAIGKNHPGWKGGTKVSQSGTKARKYLVKNRIDVQREDIMDLYIPLKQYYHSLILSKGGLNEKDRNNNKQRCN